jgi:diguanylate cyclase (GGDEF)-like protein
MTERLYCFEKRREDYCFGPNQAISEALDAQACSTCLNATLDQLVEIRTAQAQNTDQLVKTVDAMNYIGKRYMEVDAKQKALAESASTDDMTGLISSRRTFTERAFETLSSEPPAIEERCYDREFYSVIFLDLDHFKQVNDQFGHDAGDDVLRRVAQHVQLRNEDQAAVSARWGGEEVAIMLPWTGMSGGLAAAERLRSEIAQTVYLPNGQPVTASLGVAVGRADALTAEALGTAISQADRAMYHAKREGRNTVAYYNSDTGECLLDNEAPQAIINNLDVAT